MDKKTFDEIEQQLLERGKNTKWESSIQIIRANKDLAVMDFIRCIPEFTGKNSLDYFAGIGIIQMSEAEKQFLEEKKKYLQNAFAVFDYSQMRNRSFYIDNDCKNQKNIISELLHSIGATVKRSFSNKVDYYVTSKKSIPLKAPIADTELQLAIDSFSERVKAFFVNVFDMIEQIQKWRVENETFEEKVERAKALINKIIKKLDVHLYDYGCNPIATGLSEFSCIFKDNIDDAIKFDELSGEPRIADILYALQKRGNYEIEGLCGLDVIVKTLVACDLFINPCAAYIELARDKWEYRGDYSSKYRIGFTYPELVIIKNRYNEYSM